MAALKHHEVLPTTSPPTTRQLGHLTMSSLGTHGVTTFRNLSMVAVAEEDQTLQVRTKFAGHLKEKWVEPVCSFAAEGDYVLLRGASNKYYIWMPDDDYCRLGFADEALCALKDQTKHWNMSFSGPEASELNYQ